MLTVSLASSAASAATLALPVDAVGTPRPTALNVSGELVTECAAFWEQLEEVGRPGSVHRLPRPLARPRQVLLVDAGEGDESGWRAAGAGLARAAVRDRSLTVALPVGASEQALQGLVEGLQLASYRFRLGSDDPATAPRLHRVTIVVDEPARYEVPMALAQEVARATCMARDLTNMPSIRKDPAWIAGQAQQAASGLPGLQVQVRAVPELREGDFGGILAVGSGSESAPRLVELSWHPPEASIHVVLVGKGITFDTGGVSIKPSSSMTLMRKDMAGAAAVIAAAIGAARLRLPVRVTALAPLAENMVSGSAMRPGDVVRHWGGKTTEVRNTDAEGRLVLADVLAYSAARLEPDVLVDLATLTGANAVALGRRTGALYSDDDTLAEALTRSATAAGEQVWRMPLPDDYLEGISGEVADLLNSPGGPGSVMAALYLREFVGQARDRWAHIDMSAPAWCESDEAELSRGATGWGVRTLLRWLSTLT